MAENKPVNSGVPEGGQPKPTAAANPVAPAAPSGTPPVPASPAPAGTPLAAPASVPAPVLPSGTASKPLATPAAATPLSATPPPAAAISVTASAPPPPPVPQTPAFNLASQPTPNSSGNANGNGQSLLSKLLPGKTVPAAATSMPSAQQQGAAKSVPQSGANSVAPPQKSAQTIATLLGPKPKFSAIITEDKEIKLRGIGRIVFSLSLVALIGVYGFFYTQLNPEFTMLNDQLGPNLAVQFETSSKELKEKQTQKNLVRFRRARLLLDDINTQIDPFQQQTLIAESPYSPPALVNEAKDELQILGASLKTALAEVQTLLREPLGIETFSENPMTLAERESEFEKLLIEKLAQEKNALLANNGGSNPVEARSIDNVLRLVSNRGFRTTILTQNLESESEFSAVLAKIRDEGTDELSSIDKIRRKRLDWARVIQDIHAVVSKTDPYYGRGFFQTVGGFLFASYQFDSKSGRISISGLTKQSDSKIFTMIANLVDSIEKSRTFRDIDFRSFAKSRDEKGDFTSSLALEFSLQQGDDPRDEAEALPEVVPPPPALETVPEAAAEVPAT